MGCTASTHTTAQDTTRPNSKPEELNGASTTGAASEKEDEEVNECVPEAGGENPEAPQSSADESQPEAEAEAKDPAHAAQDEGSPEAAPAETPAEETPGSPEAAPAEETPAPSEES